LIETRPKGSIPSPIRIRKIQEVTIQEVPPRNIKRSFTHLTDDSKQTPQTLAAGTNIVRAAPETPSARNITLAKLPDSHSIVGFVRLVLRLA
jgi:hypothetical protein